MKIAHLALASVLLAGSQTLYAAPQQQQDAESRFHRAYYLQNEERDLDRAHELFSSVAADASAPEALRRRARQAASALEEDLATTDLAALMPPETLLYVELDRPGEKLKRLLSQLGLLGKKDEISRQFAISPYLIESVIGLRGAAVGVFQIDAKGEPERAALVLHPGEFDTLRGLIETVLPADGEPADPIAGYATWQMKGALVTLTERLALVGTDRASLAAMISRLKGETSNSLAQSTPLREVLRGSDSALISFYLQGAPLRPFLHNALQAAAQKDPEALLAMRFFDVESLESLAGQLNIEQNEVQLEVDLDLAQGHRNMAFNLLRLPSLRKGDLERIPGGVAFFASTALNQARPPAPKPDAPAPRPVSAMDFGRELFGNLMDVSVFGFPSGDGTPMPELVLSMHSNDVEQSYALWNLVLGVSSAASKTGAFEPRADHPGGLHLEPYTIQGRTIYLAQTESEIWISPSAQALKRSWQARLNGHSVLQEKTFAQRMPANLEQSSMLAMVLPGRCALMASRMKQGQERAQLEQISEVLKDALVTLSLQQTATRLGFEARVSDVPDLSALISRALQGHGNGGSYVESAPDHSDGAESLSLSNK